MATRVCRYGPPITALPRRWRQKTPARNAMANTNANAFVTAYNEHAIHRSFHPFARSSRKRDFGTTSTADGTRIFFEWLEKTYGARFGGKPLPMDGGVTTVTSDNGNTVNESRNCEENLMVTRESLELEDLEKLFQHEISVLKIRNFYPQEASSSLGRELALEGRSTRAQNWKVSTSKGLESSDVMTVGCHAPYNIALANKATDEYFREVRNELRDRRGLAPRDGNAIDNIKKNNNNRHRKTQQEERRRDNLGQSRLWPLDLLRLELDELWPRGAGLARANHETHHQMCMGGGLPRLMVGPTRWKKGLVHVDELAPLSQTKGCFSANIYLQLPYGDFKSNTNNSEQQEQPVIELWPLGIRSKWDWYRNAPTLSHLASQDPEGQVVLRKALGDDYKLQISAAPGDLVLLCVQRPHCAIGFGHECVHGDGNGNGTTTTTSNLQTRVSLQCFLQYNGGDERLTIDS